MLPLIAVSHAKPNPGEFRLTLLDVGQGLSAVIETQNHTLVYDTGARFSDYFDAGEAVVIPFLRARNVRTVDRLVISHGDNDHMGGTEALIRTLPVKELLTSSTEVLSYQNAKRCVAGDQWTWDGVTFEILHPPVRWQGSDNDRSCVLRVRNAQGSALLTGDIEAAAETYLAKTMRNELRSDIMLIPHHASRTSSLPAFIHAVDPELALLSFGYRNKFGFPKPDVLQRYEKSEIEVLDTVSQGAITVSVNPIRGIIRLPGYRRLSTRYWSTRP